MNSEQITKILKSHRKTRKYFKGVYSIDTIPYISKNRSGIYIVNNDYKNGTGK